MSWRDAVIYQIYVRSFQDSDGDGVGDLAGVRARLDYLADLGIDALWLTPVNRSPQVDYGYDVSDYETIDPSLGTLAEFDALLADAHSHGLRVLMDLVIGHTSIEHPWFRAFPERYVFAGGDQPPNNWRSMFGGSAWSEDPYGRGCYLHTFHPEQPDLDWHSPDVVLAIQEVVEHWRGRGVDGFRLDAASLLVKDPKLRDDPPAREPPVLPYPAEYAELEHEHSAVSAAAPSVLAALREAARGAFLVAEAYLPTAELQPYLDVVDAAFAFEFLYAPWRAESLARVIAEAAAIGRRSTGSPAWVLSNHDFGRVAGRVGPANARSAALLLLTLPGPVFLYQGDELQMTAGNGGRAALDRHGRDRYRHPMRWDATDAGGFTTGAPWLPVDETAPADAATQQRDPGSMLSLHRRLIALRRSIDGPVRDLLADGEVVSFRRGRYRIAVNTGASPAPLDGAGELVLETHPDALDRDRALRAHSAIVLAE